MAYGGGGLFWRLCRTGSTLQQLEGGGITVDWTLILALISTAALAVYLTIALLKPEMFS